MTDDAGPLTEVLGGESLGADGLTPARVQDAFDKLRNDVLGLFPPLLELVEDGGMDEAASRLAAARARLRNGGLTTVVCGEFKRGKSQLLNALLGMPGLFPTDIDIATNLVTVAAYGDELRLTANVVTAGDDDAGTEDLDVAIEDLAAFVTEAGNPGNERGVRLVQAMVPNERLASGLRLVDTPGIGALNTEHSEATYAFLPNADAVIFVCDATQPLTESELDFLGRILGVCDFVVFVVTKIDLVDDVEPVLANTRAKIAAVTGNEVGADLVVPVSSVAQLEALETGDDELAELSGFAALEDLLWTGLERRRGQVLLLQALADLDRTAEALLRPIDAQLDALAADGDTSVADAELAANRDRLGDLKNNKARWRKDLAQGIADIQKRLRNQLATGVAQVRKRLETMYLVDEMLFRDGDKIVDRVRADINVLLGGLAADARTAASALHADLEASTTLTLDRYDVGDFEIPDAVLDVSLALPSMAVEGSGFRTWRETVMSMGVGATTVGIIGSVVSMGTLLPFFAAGAAVAAGAAGAQSAQRTIKAQEKSQRAQAIRTQIGPLFTAVGVEGPDAIERTLRAFAQDLEAELDAKIRLEYDSLSAAVAGVKKAKQASAAETKARIDELREPRAKLDTALRRIEVLRTRAARLTDVAADAPLVDDFGSFADA